MTRHRHDFAIRVTEPNAKWVRHFMADVDASHEGRGTMKQGRPSIACSELPGSTWEKNASTILLPTRNPRCYASHLRHAMELPDILRSDERIALVYDYAPEFGELTHMERSDMDNMLEYIREMFGDNRVLSREDAIERIVNASSVVGV